MLTAAPLLLGDALGLCCLPQKVELVQDLTWVAKGVVARVESYFVTPLMDMPQELPDPRVGYRIVSIYYSGTTVGHEIEAASQTLLFAEVHDEPEGVAQVGV
jgi:hypothetical protein